MDNRMLVLGLFGFIAVMLLFGCAGRGGVNSGANSGINNRANGLGDSDISPAQAQDIPPVGEENLIGPDVSGTPLTTAQVDSLVSDIDVVQDSNFDVGSVDDANLVEDGW